MLMSQQNRKYNHTILYGKHEDGNVEPIFMTNTDYLGVEIEEPLSAFGDLKTIELSPDVELNYKYGINTYLSTLGITGGSTGITEDNLAKLSVFNTGDEASIVSVKNTKYYPGQGLITRFSTRFDTGVTGNEQFIGWGEPTIDGVFIGMYDTKFCINIIKRGVNNIINQENFNIDKLDGSGHTGIRLDPTKGNVFQIQFQWHGFGNIRFYVESPTTGRYILYHIYEHTNTKTEVSTNNPVFPLAVYTRNTSYNGTITMYGGSMGSYNEGKIKRYGPRHFVSGSDTTVADTEKHLISIKNNPTINNISNRSIVYITNISISNEHTKPGIIKIYKNGGLSGSNFIDFDSINSIISTSVTGTFTNNANEIFAISMGKSDSKTIDLTNFDIFLSPNETLNVTGQESSGTNGEMYVALNFLEDL